MIYVLELLMLSSLDSLVFLFTDTYKAEFAEVSPPYSMCVLQWPTRSSGLSSSVRNKNKSCAAPSKTQNRSSPKYFPHALVRALLCPMLQNK